MLRLYRKYTISKKYYHTPISISAVPFIPVGPSYINIPLLKPFTQFYNINLLFILCLLLLYNVASCSLLHILMYISFYLFNISFSLTDLVSSPFFDL